MKKPALTFLCMAGALAASGATDCPFSVRQNWPWDGRVFIDVTMPEGTNDVELVAKRSGG